MATHRQSIFGERRERPLHEVDPEYEGELRGGNGEGEVPRGGVGALVGELIGETSALMRAEIALARNEMQDNLGHMQRGIGAMVAGGAVLGAGLLALLACVILALSTRMDAWLAAFIVGAVTVVCGAIMLAIGKRKAATEGWKPQRTLGSFQEMRELARHEKQRAMRKWR